MKKLIIITFICVVTCFGKINATSNWTNYNNFSQVTDAQPNGTDIFITAKGGVLITNTLTDSKRFFNMSNSSLPSNAVEQVAKSTTTGDIWIGTYDNGLARWNGRDFIPTAYPATFGLLLNMKFGPDGMLYLQSDNGAFQFNTATKTFTQFNVSSTNVWLYNAWSFDFTSAGDLVVFTGTNCLTIDLPSLNIIDSFDTLSTPLVSGCSSASASLFYFNTDNMLINIANSTVGFLHRDGTSSDANAGLPIFSYIETMRGSDNQMYCILDNQEVYRLVDTTWNFVYSLGSDNLATKYFYEDGSTSYVNTTDFNNMSLDEVFHARGIVHNKIDSRKYVFQSTLMNSVFKDDAGKIYAVSATNIYQYDNTNDTWLNYVTAPSIFGEIRHVKYFNGNIYVENYGNLLEFYDGSTWTQIPMAAGSSSPYIFSYDVTSTGTIYFCNDEGVYKYESGTTTKLLSTTSFAAWFFSIKYDATRNVLWLGKSNEIVSYDFSSLTTYNHASFTNLPATMSVQVIEINPLDNTIWFGSSDNQVFHYDGVNFTTLSTPNPSVAFIDQILFESTGKVIVKNIDSYGGFYTYDHGIWNRFHPEVMSDMTTASVASIVIDQDGNYWTANSDANGVSRYRNEATGIENDLQQIATINVFPNPANSQVQVLLNDERAAIKIFDISGHEVSTSIVRKDQLVSISTQTLPNGLYLLKANTQTVKFIVQH